MRYPKINVNFERKEKNFKIMELLTIKLKKLFSENDIIQKLEIAGPGFINIFKSLIENLVQFF